MIQSINSAIVSPIERLEQVVQAERNELVQHPVYSSIHSIDDLRWFMENHVFAVWDFMSLLKTLQRALTCVTVPWRPVGSSSLRRFINEIVLGEESDVDLHGQFVSHFEMYLASMREVGASTRAVEQVLQLLEKGVSPGDALREAEAPLPAQAFTNHTFQLIESNSLPRLSASFTFGREDLIPAMFQSALDLIGQGSADFAPRFRYYLQRHIDVDGDSHSGLARQMVSEICRDPGDWQQAEEAAIESLSARKRLWDGVHQGISRSR
jgi:hypothetical protein